MMPHDETTHSDGFKKLLLLAKRARTEGRPASAFELYRLILDRDPNRDSAIYHAVSNLVDIGRISDAETYFEKIRRNAAPKPWLIEFALGDLRMARGRLSEAEIHFRNSWRMNPKSATPAVFLAESLFRQEKFAEAKEVLLEALNAGDELGEVYYNLGWVALATGDYRSARDYLLKALEIEPEYAEAKECLADVEFWLDFCGHGGEQQ